MKAKIVAEKERRRKERMDEQKNRIENRLKQDKESKSKVREILSHKPLYLKKEEEFIKVEMSSLQEKKKQLEDIRNFYKPIKSEAIIQHQNHYETLKKDNIKEI